MGYKFGPSYFLNKHGDLFFLFFDTDIDWER